MAIYGNMQWILRWDEFLSGRKTFYWDYGLPSFPFFLPFNHFFRHVSWSALLLYSGLVSCHILVVMVGVWLGMSVQSGVAPSSVCALSFAAWVVLSRMDSHPYIAHVLTEPIYHFIPVTYITWPTCDNAQSCLLCCVVNGFIQQLLIMFVVPER